MSRPNAAAEAQRQQLLLGALHGQVPANAMGAYLRDAAPRARRGLLAYAANAGALAERALLAAYPTLAQLLGGVACAALARAFWRAQPPAQGDIAQWGAALPGFIASDPQLAGEPYLADVARLDWAVHQAEQAGAPGEAPTGLALLASAEPEGLWLQLAAGTAVVCSVHPVATLWRAHRSPETDRFAPVRTAFANRSAECALVWRDGYLAQVTALPAAGAAFTQAVLAGQSLGQALESADPGFAFEPWLLAALRQGWLAAVDTRRAPPPAASAGLRAGPSQPGRESGLASTPPGGQAREA